METVRVVRTASLVFLGAAVLCVVAGLALLAWAYRVRSPSGHLAVAQ